MTLSTETSEDRMAVHSVAQALYLEERGNWGYDPGSPLHRPWYERAERVLAHSSRHVAAVEDVVWRLGDYIASGSDEPVDVWMERRLKTCGVCGGEPLNDTDGPDGESMQRVCGACTPPPGSVL